jgi:hypothetical protein
MAMCRSGGDYTQYRLKPVTPYTSYLADCRLLGISTCPL